MRYAHLAASLVAVFGLAGGARADDSLMGTRGLVVEKEHRIEVTLAPGHATLVVRRTVENLGKRHDQAVWQISVPDSAVATALRTKGLLNGKPVWFAGELMEAEAAAMKYRELTGIGGYYPKDPALLSWRHQGELALQVFPVAPADRKTVGYTLKMPTGYRDGRHELKLPQLGAAGEAASIVIRPARGEDRIFVDGQPFPTGGQLAWPAQAPGEDAPDAEARDPVATVALVPAWAPAIGGAMASKRFGDGRVLVRYRIEAAPRLGRVPRDAQVVVILDWSRSLAANHCEAGVAAAGAFLRHFEGAAVEVLTVDRQVLRRHGRFVPAARAMADLVELRVVQRNGSNLDAALARADELLAAAPAGHARRVLLLSDLLTRSTLDVAKLAGVLQRSGALLHVGRIDVGRPSLQADYEGDWSGVARATGGLLWQASLTSAAAQKGRLVAALEEWARPVRVHRFRVAAPYVDLAPDTGAEALSEERLAEGQGVAGLQIAGDEPPWIEIAGELWARPVRERWAPDAGESRLWSALVFGSAIRTELSEREMMVLARHGGAVSPVTSYLAIEPGVRPSTEGLEEEAFGVGGLGLLGTGYGSGGTGEYVAHAVLDHLAWLREALAPALGKCGYPGSASVTLETTIAEIVDVPAVSPNRSGDRACLREAVWALELPSAFNHQRQTWTVPLTPR